MTAAAKTKTESLVVTFDRERETKRTVRFAERVDDDAPESIGTVYVQKHALRDLGNPDSIRVTVEAV